MPWYTWSIFRSRARRATVSEMRLVMIPVLIPARRASEIAVPSWALKPLASIRLVLWRPKPLRVSLRETLAADFSRRLCGAPDCSPPEGAGNIQILPSVRTPSTSKRMSLILRARALADDLGIAEILAGRGKLGFVSAHRASHLLVTLFAFAEEVSLPKPVQ